MAPNPPNKYATGECHGECDSCANTLDFMVSLYAEIFFVLSFTEVGGRVEKRKGKREEKNEG